MTHYREHHEIENLLYLYIGRRLIDTFLIRANIRSISNKYRQINFKHIESIPNLFIVLKTDAIRGVKSHFTCYVFIQHLKRIYYLFQKHFQTSVLHTSYHTFHPYCGADIGIQETFLRFVIL